MYDYDLVVIGSGPAGEKGAAQAAWFGKRVALVERAPALGGACVHTGTIPSKTLRETSLVLSGARQRSLYGIGLELRGGITIGNLMVRQEPVCRSEVQRIENNLERHRVTRLRGEASFLDEHTLRVAGGDAGDDARTVTTDVVLIATGSSPYHPPNIPFGEAVDDSDTILRIDRIPKSLVVLGAGVIGCEYASIFAALGVQVTLLEQRNMLLSFLDDELSGILTERFRELGIDIRFQSEVKTVERRDGGVRVTLAGGDELRAERLLCAAGRNSNTGSLGLDRIGATVEKRGLLKVDAAYRIAGPKDGRVYAAGDVIGFPSLASTSMEQARVAMCHAFEIGYKTRVGQNLPYGLYTIPEASMVGITEEDAIAAGMDVTVGRARYGSVARGQIIGDLDGLLKLVFRSEDKRLIGVHIIGERATELVHIGQMVIHFGGTIDAFIEEVFNYPTLAELYKYAAYDGLGNLARRKALGAQG